MACTNPFTDAWYEERITATKAEIVALETAIAALAGGAQTYTLDTGQTRQSVTRQQIGSLRNQLDNAYNRLETLVAKCNGASMRIVPGY